MKKMKIFHRPFCKKIQHKSYIVLHYCLYTCLSM
jgi:hypothetical protein